MSVAQNDAGIGSRRTEATRVRDGRGSELRRLWALVALLVPAPGHGADGAGGPPLAQHRPRSACRAGSRLEGRGRPVGPAWTEPRTGPRSRRAWGGRGAG